MTQTESADYRKWYRKKRNIARIAIVLTGLIGAVIAASYPSDERRVLWTEIGSGSAALLFYSYFVPYLRAVVKRKIAPPAPLRYLFLALLGVMLLYMVMLLGGGLLDAIREPETERVTIAERWNPKRGGDQVRTSEGDIYEIYAERVRLEEGGTYWVKTFRYGNAIIGVGRADPDGAK
ncbi:hypothetical protein [Paenibacillus flagellatus]|uniref:Uncharacterized protein n=1 Tax=Paenibacillus flagellatus TaxID=2211139 RepID=A0A2V5K9Y9_9BACL|nr:hypothetical protein [Paenibacillus flagellatus]PYI56228.1 hypothetical protein DLM86_04370 [Paenibacillus flagellatus]